MPDAMQTFAQEYAIYGYPVLFVGVLLENMGVPVPGETAVLMAGFLASPAGGGHFDIAWVIGLTVLAAVIGDNLGFWLGHRFARPRLQNGQRFLILTPKTLEVAEGYFHRYGLWTVFFARFITGLRVFGALAAGTAGMHWTRFLIANAAGALAWATLMSCLGYFFGHSLELLHTYLSRGGMVLLGCVVVLVGLPFLWRRLRNMRFQALEGLTRAQIVQGVLSAVLQVIVIGVLVKMAGGRHETDFDRHVAAWIEAHPAGTARLLATLGNLVGSLPVVAVVTALVVAQTQWAGRSWREAAAAVWALTASELAGLTLVGLIHSGRVVPRYAEFWPHGFAGLVALRSLAVYGMAAALISRQYPAWGRGAAVLAVGLTLFAGFGVVWTIEQTFTETVLELAAGALVLYAGLWWLELGPGLGPMRANGMEARRVSEGE